MYVPHPVVLVGRHCRELGLGEDERPEVLGVSGVLPGGRDVDDVEARLVLVHRVEDDLGAVVTGELAPGRPYMPVIVQLVVGQLQLVE